MRDSLGIHILQNKSNKMRKTTIYQTLVPAAMLLLVVGITSDDTYIKFTLMGASILLNFTALLLNTQQKKSRS